ncbi:hypothetical protein CMUS01_00482 [Colletotrichum musicola]|uniref:Uncharacterized protein n=1 Tax=Colletotrichum musicola TaxID=2175873 RepID=A0A8H6NYY9_9PEZI|nr:hypothetical protein CMUS01_00482 [Colletotrichum musicola]
MGPIKKQTRALRVHYGIEGTERDDYHDACWHPLSTIKRNHEEIVLRERGLKSHTKEPYKSPSPMQMVSEKPSIQIPRPPRPPLSTIDASPISYSSEEGATTTSPVVTRGHTAPGEPMVLVTQEHASARTEPPVKLAETPRRHTLHQDPKVRVGYLPANHVVYQDPSMKVAEPSQTHAVHQDSTFKVAETPREHEVQDDAVVETARWQTPHLVHHDPRAKVASAQPTHISVHADPRVRVADAPNAHSVHDDPRVKTAEVSQAHGVDTDPTVKVSEASEPHTVYDDEKAGFNDRDNTHNHELSAAPTPASSPAPPKSLNNDGTMDMPGAF